MTCVIFLEVYRRTAPNVPSVFLVAPGPRWTFASRETCGARSGSFRPSVGTREFGDFPELHGYPFLRALTVPYAPGVPPSVLSDGRTRFPWRMPFRRPCAGSRSSTRVASSPPCPSALSRLWADEKQTICGRGRGRAGRARGFPTPPQNPRCRGGWREDVRSGRGNVLRGPNQRSEIL